MTATPVRRDGTSIGNGDYTASVHALLIERVDAVCCIFYEWATEAYQAFEED